MNMQSASAYLSGPQKPVPVSELGDEMGDYALLRKLRATHGVIPQEIEDFVLRRQAGVHTGRRSFRQKLEPVGLILALLTGVLFAPVAMVAALMALSQRNFTGFGGDYFFVDLVRSLSSAQLFSADMFGYLAAASMLLTFCMTSAVLLRLFAILTNIFFLSYGVIDQLVPVVLLHAILLPINTSHLSRAVRARLDIRRKHAMLRAAKT